MVGIILTIVSLIVTSWVAYERNQKLVLDLKNNLDNMTRLQAIAVSDAMWNLNRETMREIISGARVNSDFHSSRVVAENGEVLAEISGPPMPASELFTSQQIVTFGSGDSKRTLGHIEVTISSQELTKMQQSSLRDVVTIGVIQLIAVILGTGLVLRTIIKPLESIRESLMGLAQSDTDLDIPEQNRKDQIGDMAKAVGIFRESLIEIKRLQAEDSIKAEKLEQARIIAESANKAKSVFLSSMSHEIRNPLNAILGHSQILARQKKEPLTATQSASVEQIINSGELLLRLIEDLLDLSKIEAGKLEASIEDIAVNECLQECISMLEHSAKQRNIKISFLGREHHYSVRADRRRVKQVALNFLSNAIKYGVENGKVSIEMFETSDDFLRTSFIDNGVGIPQEQHPDLFRPFSRLGLEGSNISGTGIGLTLSKEIITLMGGQVGFESEVDEGSTFWFELPLASNGGLAGGQ